MQKLQKINTFLFYTFKNVNKLFHMTIFHPVSYYK